MSRPLWFVHLLKKALPSLFLAARTTHVPLWGNLVDRWLFGGDDLIYLPTDHTVQIHQTIDAQAEMVLPSQVVEYFIAQASTHWIMDACICRAAIGCEDYPIDLGCLFIGQAAAGINPRLGRPVTQAEALDHVRRCREAGLVHLIGRNKLDTIWLGVGPGDRLLTICNCCPCCCLWRTLPYLAPMIGSKVSRMLGVTVHVTESCAGCGACTQNVCFVDAIRLEDGRARISDTCRGCGRCVDVCPQKAITISIQDERFIQLSIDRITPLVDVA